MAHDSPIAIVGMACIFPDARTPVELWENVLAQRRAFRRLPACRLRAEDYVSADRSAPDSTYVTDAAVIEGYEFDRVAFRVSGGAFRSVDMAHWLALDVASRALADAGLTGGLGLPREATGVLVGNSLTGEFSRANLMRLRWPYVRRVVSDALSREELSPDRRRDFLRRLEEKYKEPFPPMGEETLAGGLSNTIAGRICNYFDLNGGGYTVDGACASSLLAVANACSALAAGDLDVALAGGVDLSLDPFELVGFARIGALADDEMRVFDRSATGFWPGEGCGMVVLARHSDALANGWRVYCTIRGWGVSSDGGGGITRPEAKGQVEAVRRAYRRAGYAADSTAYCEGHGTGTEVGDATELEALSQARHESNAAGRPAALGSIKANIGHTKAASGIASLIKAVMAVHSEILPPTTGCEQPHELLTGADSPLRIPLEAEVWPSECALRASVSAMGFGGINTHLAIEGVATKRREALGPRECLLSRSKQDTELFLLSAPDRDALLRQVDRLSNWTGQLSRAEMADLAATLSKTVDFGRVRAAIVASKPTELVDRLNILSGWLKQDVASRSGITEHVFFGSQESVPRIVFMFPGQGSPTHLGGGLWRRRFETVSEVYAKAGLPREGDSSSTRLAQPAVVTASLAGLKMLATFGIAADTAIGHSLGEITALCWAGVFDDESLLRIVRARAAAMSDLEAPTGAMLAVAAPWFDVQSMINGDPLSVVGFNSPRQTVVAGEAGAVGNLAKRASARGWQSSLLPVSHAFHTPHVAGATPRLALQLAAENFASPSRPVVSTVTGAPIAEGEDLRSLLCRQVTSPVRFNGGLEEVLRRKPVDLLVEVGPGSVLQGLAQEITNQPVIALNAGGPSLEGLLLVLGAAFAMGCPVKHEALFADRFTRPFDLDWKPRFFVNPCELAPLSPKEVEVAAKTTSVPTAESCPCLADDPGTPLMEAKMTGAERVRRLVAKKAELPIASVRDDHRMLSDLHLNSITVGQLVSEAAKQLGLAHVVGLTDFANASVAEIGVALEEMSASGGTSRRDSSKRPPPGIANWVRAYTLDLVETKRPAHPPRRSNGILSSPAGWQVFAPKDHLFAAPLRDELNRSGESGVAVCLPANPTEDHVHLLLEAGRMVLSRKDRRHFLLVQHGWGGGGFARTLHLEEPGLNTCVVNVPLANPRSIEWILAEIKAVNGFSEVHFTGEGRRLEPRLKFARRSREHPEILPSIGPGDVLLVTGGGKGIAAECALAVSRATGVRLALMGRSDPASDAELAENLARMKAAGVLCLYLKADVTDVHAVREAVERTEGQLGPVTAVLHGAGANAPHLIESLGESAFRETLAPKIRGARNILAAVDTARLRLFITFGSIIARTGLAGEADYATANEWLTKLTEEFHDSHPRCRCLALEWSVWSGVGMGQRLGRIDSLAEIGITPIAVDEGVRTLVELIETPPVGAATVITGRFGQPPTLKLVESDMPLRRFLERKRVHYPGVELVVDADLSVRTDPYLEDHVVQTQRLFPGVMGLEAMAQAAMAVCSTEQIPVFEKVEFLRPVGVSDQAAVTIRLVALQIEPCLVEVALRSGETDFQVDHFRALCRFGTGEETTLNLAASALDTGLLALNPERDLYGRILFHQGRFRRLRGYQLLRSKECVAEITQNEPTAWFGAYLPAGFALGDPAGRDAALHSIQACIPHQRILPTGIDRLVILRIEQGSRWVRAVERSHQGNDFVYDVVIVDAGGRVVERWDGLRLRGIEVMPPREAWPATLLAPYFERRLADVLPECSLSVAFQPERGKGSQKTSHRLIRQLLGREERIWRRPDGKPVIAGSESVSAAHSQHLTLAVTCAWPCACDLETVNHRAESIWSGLLGAEGFLLARHIAQKCAAEFDTAATRVWSALECLKKAGLPPGAPLVFESSAEVGWVKFRCGSLAVASSLLVASESDSPLVATFAIDTALAGQPLDRMGKMAPIAVRYPKLERDSPPAVSIGA